MEHPGCKGKPQPAAVANITQVVRKCRIDLIGIHDYHLGFALLEAANIALHNDYKCYVAPGHEPHMAFLVCNALVPFILEVTGNEPRVAFLVRNALLPFILEVIYSPWGLAAAIWPQFPHIPRKTIVYVYSKFTSHNKLEVDLFIDSMQPYDILVGDYTDNVWSPTVTRPWQTN